MILNGTYNYPFWPQQAAAVFSEADSASGAGGGGGAGANSRGSAGGGGGVAQQAAAAGGVENLPWPFSADALMPHGGWIPCSSEYYWGKCEQWPTAGTTVQQQDLASVLTTCAVVFGGCVVHKDPCCAFLR